LVHPKLFNHYWATLQEAGVENSTALDFLALNAILFCPLLTGFVLQSKPSLPLLNATMLEVICRSKRIIWTFNRSTFDNDGTWRS